MRQMQHQTEKKSLVPEASVLCHVSWAFHSRSRLSLFVSRLMMNSTSWIKETVLKLPVNCYKCTNRILLSKRPDFGEVSASYPPLSSAVTLDIVSSSCWWLLFFSLSGRSRTGLFQLLLIHRRLDCCPQAWDCLVSLMLHEAFIARAIMHAVIDGRFDLWYLITRPHIDTRLCPKHLRHI